MTYDPSKFRAPQYGYRLGANTKEERKQREGRSAKSTKGDYEMLGKTVVRTKRSRLSHRNTESFE